MNIPAKIVWLMVLFFCLVFPNIFAQNEASKDFVQGSVLERQSGSSFDKFPKIVCAFSCRGIGRS
jgi:hypothetical protein